MELQDRDICRTASISRDLRRIIRQKKGNAGRKKNRRRNLTWQRRNGSRKKKTERPACAIKIYEANNNPKNRRLGNVSKVEGGGGGEEERGGGGGGEGGGEPVVAPSSSDSLPPAYQRFLHPRMNIYFA